MNIDEDAFLLDPKALFKLIQFMEDGGYAACGMPDGGVVPIRHHHPVACNAFFNIFNLQCVRPAWSNWDLAIKSPHRPEYELLIPDIASRGKRAFDDFEPYYCLFFSLLESKQTVLYLDANQWKDGISTLLKAPWGAPLLLHGWYARDWTYDRSHQERYRLLAEYTRAFRENIQ